MGSRSRSVVASAASILLVVVVFAFQFCAGGGFDIPGSPDLGGADQASAGESGPDLGGTLAERTDAVVDDIQVMWDQDIFRPAGRTYRDTEVVLFTDRTDSGCGVASAATGPFYCPADGLVYLDLGFFRELDERFGAPGDFAQAYVIAHEIGHHVQTLLGTNAAVQRESRDNPSERNELSVRLELQADCFAGVWAASAYARDVLEPGDIDEALAAAAAVGDDRIQQQTPGADRPRDLHARDVRAAGDLVQDRLRLGRPERLRHVRRRHLAMAPTGRSLRAGVPSRARRRGTRVSRRRRSSRRSPAMEPGRALDVGCGTGTNVLWLAQHGWTAIGVDRSPTAIESARRRADWTSGAMFAEGDVTRLEELQVDGPFDLILDIGCFHGVPASRRERVRPRGGPGRPARGTDVDVRSWAAGMRGPAPPRTREPEIRRRFGAVFEIERVVPGRDPQGAAWFFLRRR